jgi:5-methyltetrahydrofolate--homocysteine methyltransferase
MLPYMERLSAVAEVYTSAHPNAGLPNVMGGYDETPVMFATDCGEYLQRGLVNILGGCCGTTPEHIFELSKIVGNYAPWPRPERSHTTVLSGLEPLRIVPQSNFINVGERTNVAGSARFARLIRTGAYDEALSVARAQVDAGAQIVDVCMDDGLIDGVQAMSHFLKLLASEPEIARVPIMIDSSKWAILETGMQLVQGKCIVNSISLKEGEERFLSHARQIHRYGAAAVVMLFDERGQADTFDRKVEVARRAYTLLTGSGFPAEDIVFDPNILAVATGIEAHDRYALDFIEATRWIKSNLPYAKVSGGVSNLSFAFRGNNRVREAMHSAFLYHAVAAGMDMGIVNTELLQVYSDIPTELLERVEDVILCRRVDASERLIDYAQQLRDADTSTSATQQSETWRERPVAERIEYAMLKGVTDHIEEDVLEAYRQLGNPLAVIDQMLMRAMARVGELFGSGKMFLPQVVKSARVMKQAVARLTPYIEEHKQEGHTVGKVLVATVKGDVHDIGKNIVSVVMACNGYEVKDLGVMVEAPTIVDEAATWGADAICLSGLITPSLDEMMHVVEEAARRGLNTPFVIGGATTSELHTAVKIAPLTAAPVVHSRDASQNNRILAALLGDDRESFIAEVRARQQQLRDAYEHEERARNLIPIVEVRKERKSRPVSEIVPAAHTGRLVFPDFDIADVEPLIDWNFFFASWGLKGRYPEILSHSEKGEEARKVFADAQTLLHRMAEERLLTLQGVVGIFPAVGHKDDIVITDTKGHSHILPMLRNQSRGSEHLCLADFLVDHRCGTSDYIGLFALTAGIGLQELCTKFREQNDDYSAILAKLLADRLTEAFAETVHSFVRRQMWGYEQGPELTPKQIIAGDYRGCRMAFGYPASPDHSLKRDVFDLLAVEQTTRMRLTDNYMIVPGEALCGMIFSDARYFSVGHIGTKQLNDYATRRRCDVEQIRKIIPNNLI